MEKMGTLKKNGDQKTNFGPHGDQSPQMGTNVGAVRTVGVSNYIQVDAIINLGYFKKDPSPVAAGQRHFLC